MISFSSPSLSWPNPGPPSSSSRNSAHRPWSFTCCWRLLTYALTVGSGERTAYGNTYSSGSTSSLQNSSTQSSFFWNSGSVEKSHAMGASKAGMVDEEGGDGAGRALGEPVPLTFERLEPVRRINVVGGELCGPRPESEVLGAVDVEGRHLRRPEVLRAQERQRPVPAQRGGRRARLPELRGVRLRVAGVE